MPPLEDVKERVSEAALREKKAEALSEFAQKVRDEAEKALEEGKTFAEAVKAHDLEALPTGEFSAQTGIESNFFSRPIMESVRTVNRGEVSEIIPAGGDVLFAYVKTRSPGDFAAFDGLRPAIIDNLARERSDVLFRELPAKRCSIRPASRATWVRMRKKAVRTPRKKRRRRPKPSDPPGI